MRCQTKRDKTRPRGTARGRSVRVGGLCPTLRGVPQWITPPTPQVALSVNVTFATQIMKTTRRVSDIYDNPPLETIFETRSRQNEASGTKICPRMLKRYKIKLLGCLLVTLGLQKGALGAHLGDPGAPKWCLGCPWGLGAPLGHPWVTLGDPGVTMVG